MADIGTTAIANSDISPIPRTWGSSGIVLIGIPSYTVIGISREVGFVSFCGIDFEMTFDGHICAGFELDDDIGIDGEGNATIDCHTARHNIRTVCTGPSCITVDAATDICGSINYRLKYQYKIQYFFH